MNENAIPIDNVAAWFRLTPSAIKRYATELKIGRIENEETVFTLEEFNVLKANLPGYPVLLRKEHR